MNHTFCELPNDVTTSNRYIRNLNLSLKSPFVRFLLVGGSSTLLQFSLLIAMVEFGKIQEVYASASSYALSAIANYTLNYKLTFASTTKHRESFSKFVVVATLGLGINTLSFYLFSKVFAYYILAQISATVFTTIVNYLLHRHWIYKIDQ